MNGKVCVASQGLLAWRVDGSCMARGPGMKAKILSGKAQRPSLGTAAPNGFELSRGGGAWELCMCACVCVCTRGLEGLPCLVAIGCCLQYFLFMVTGAVTCTTSHINQWCVAYRWTVSDGFNMGCSVCEK